MLKQYFHKFIFITFFNFCLIGCSSGNLISDTTNVSPSPTINRIESTITPFPVQTINPTALPITETPLAGKVLDQSESIYYTINVIFDYLSQTANVEQRIIYKNNSQIPLKELLLSCDVLRTDGAFLLSDSKIDGNIVNAEIGDFWLKFQLSKPLEFNHELVLDLKYQLNLPKIPEPSDDKKPVIFGYTILQSNFVDWYPMIVPRDNDGQWILHDPWFYGEYLVYPLANFDITLKIENAPVGYIIAASDAPTTVENEAHTFFYENARNFVWSISPSFQFSQEKIDGITVTSYYFPFHQAAGVHVLNEVISAIRLYSDLFGTYPRSNLSIVEADFLDGMEYDGLFFLSKGFYNLFDGTPKGYLTTIAVHETAHQWWYTLIANDQAQEPWLDEALCTYSEFLFYELAYPELAEWWWQYRVDFYNPEGKIDLPIYDYHGFMPYRDSTYLQGAKFFHNLRSRMGDEQFFQFLKEYVVENKNKISTGKDIWESINKISPNDFNDLKTEYFIK